MTASANKNGKIQSLQALRAIAFLGIFLFHGGLIWGNFGGFGASVFICLSGFLMTYSYFNKELSTGFKDSFKFAVHKLKRLYPLHIITMLMVLALFIVLALHSGTLTGEYALTLGEYTFCNIFLIQTWVPLISFNVSLNGVAWYLSVCLILYFVFPLLLKILKSYKSIKTAIITGICTYIFMVIVSVLTAQVQGLDGNFHTWITYCFPLFRVLDFFVGCNAGYVFIHRSDDGNKNVLVYTFMEIIFFAIVPFLVWWSQRSYEMVIAKAFTSTTIIFMPVSIGLIYVMAVGKGWISRLLTNPVFLYIGELSPYMFLIHFVVIFYVSSLLGFMGLAISPYIMIVIYSVCTWAAACLYKIFDDKFISKK